MLPPLPPPLPTRKPRVMAAEDFQGYRDLPKFMRALQRLRRSDFPSYAAYFNAALKPPLPPPLPLPPLPKRTLP